MGKIFVDRQSTKSSVKAFHHSQVNQLAGEAFTMLNNVRTASLGALFALSCAAMPFTVAAQQAGGVRIKGNTQLNVTTDNVNTVASGQNNVARTNIGAVKSGTQQSTNVTVNVKNVTNVATGRNKKACVNVGVVGADPNCK